MVAQPNSRSPTPATGTTSTPANSTPAVIVPSALKPIHTLLTARGWTNPTEQRYHITTASKRPATATTAADSSGLSLTYVKDPSLDDEFRIRTSRDKVTVAVPIANAPYLYASSFKSYYAATEFVEKHLDTYETAMRSNS